MEARNDQQGEHHKHEACYFILSIFAIALKAFVRENCVKSYHFYRYFYTDN